jgi:hypothetical protein
MPKLSKRKRQLKEISLRKNEDGGAESEINSTIEDNEGDEEVTIEDNKYFQTNNVGARAFKSSIKASAVQSPSMPTFTQGSVEPIWVQCNICDKWRSLPGAVDPNSLPDIWTCNLNVYDPTRQSCEATEENYAKEVDAHSHEKSFLRLWVKRLRSADRAESRLAISTRAKKRKTEVEWIRCCNPACGKWRTLTCNIDSSALLAKLHKNKYFSEREQWYCSMNSWDESTASCAAPQEPLWNCPWNLNT